MPTPFSAVSDVAPAVPDRAAPPAPAPDGGGGGGGAIPGPFPAGGGGGTLLGPFPPGGGGGGAFFATGGGDGGDGALPDPVVEELSSGILEPRAPSLKRYKFNPSSFTREPRSVGGEKFFVFPSLMDSRRLTNNF